MKPSPLPPLANLPMSVYPPSSYPPPSYFEEESGSNNSIYPALVIPAKRTNEMQRRLHDLVYHEPGRKSVYAPEDGVDYTVEDIKTTEYDPSRERKLALIRLGGGPSTPSDPRRCHDHDDVDGLVPMSSEATNGDDV